MLSINIFSIFLLSALVFAEDEGSCRSYAGGEVYPAQAKASGHSLHWSKAQSEFLICRFQKVRMKISFGSSKAGPRMGRNCCCKRRV